MLTKEEILQEMRNKLTEMTSVILDLKQDLTSFDNRITEMQQSNNNSDSFFDQISNQQYVQNFLNENTENSLQEEQRQEEQEFEQEQEIEQTNNEEEEEEEDGGDDDDDWNDENGELQAIFNELGGDEDDIEEIIGDVEEDNASENEFDLEQLINQANEETFNQD